MKNKILVACCLIFVSVFTSCKTTSARKVSKAAPVGYGSEFDGRSATVTWNRASNKEAISSYSADVYVFSMNSRVDVGMTQTNKYRLSAKQMDSSWWTRMDFASEYIGGMRDLSVISNDQKTVLFDGTEVFSVEADQKMYYKELEFLSGENIFTAVDLDKIKNEVNKIPGCDIEENKNEMIVSLPYDLLNPDDDDTGDIRIFTKITFDKKNNTLKSIQLKDDRINDTSLTTTFFIYKDIYGVPVRTGAVTEMVVTSDSVEELQTGNKGNIINSIDDVKEVNDKEYETLMQNGAVPVDFMFFGDMTDFSYVETVIEMYDNIEINSVQDSVFEKLTEER